MKRNLFHVILPVALVAVTAAKGVADTTFTADGVKVADQWVVHQTDLPLAETPGNITDDRANKIRYGYIENGEDLAKVWRAWRKDGPPKVDFAKHLVLVLTQCENAKVEFTARLDRMGDLTLTGSSTERSANGMTYAIAVIDRGAVKSINGVPLKPGK